MTKVFEDYHIDGETFIEAEEEEQKVLVTTLVDPSNENAVTLAKMRVKVSNLHSDKLSRGKFNIEK